jgi:hypothetical protein
VTNLIQLHAFYDKHKLLKEMDEATEGINPWRNDPLAFKRSIVLKNIPLGTGRSEALRLLAQEGFDCKAWSNPPKMNPVDCYLLQQPAPFGTTGRRLIQVDFDDDEKLVDANVFPLK